MVIANFDKGSTQEGVFRIYQYDYGQDSPHPGACLPLVVE